MSLDEPLRLEGFGGDVTEEGFLVEDDDDESTGTFADLVTDADPEEFDRNYRLTSSEEAFGTGEAPAIPRPWFGIPRTAIVYNLNYVYDDANDEWVRDTGNSGGGGPVSLAASGSASIIDTQTEIIFTTVTDPTLFLRPIVTFANDDPVTQVSVSVNEGSGGVKLDEVSYDIRWNGAQGPQSNEGWYIRIMNDSGANPLEVKWRVYQVTA